MNNHLKLPAMALLLLTGCAAAKPQVRLVSTACIANDQVLPVEPPRIKDQLNGQADHDLEIVAGSAMRLRAWGEGLAGIVEGCRAEPTR